jgi:hypothetical protein
MVRSLFLAFRRGGRLAGLTLRLRAILGEFYRISLVESAYCEATNRMAQKSCRAGSSMQ